MANNEQLSKSYIIDAIKNNTIKYTQQKTNPVFAHLKNETYTVVDPKGQEIIKLDRETDNNTRTSLMTIYVYFEHTCTPVATTCAGYEKKMEDKMCVGDVVEIYRMLISKYKNNKVILKQRSRVRGN